MGFLMLFILLWPTAVTAETRDIVFPVIGSVSYTDDFGAPRSGHTHEGNDLLGSKMLPLVATVDGTVRYVAYPEPSYGYYVAITDEDGYRYNYLHINNDTPGTDDGAGGGRNAYAPYMDEGLPVVAGQLIGWMGDSGNAEGTTPHLHFEIRQPDGTAISPYDSLQAADHISTPATPDALDNELLPYGEFTGGARIALGNFDEDSNLELVTAAGQGGGPNIRVLEQSGKAKSGWFAYGEDFRGGVDVAAADVDGDGIDEIITGAGIGGGPQVRIFDVDGDEVKSWFAYGESFRGGISVAAADMNADGKAEIIVAPLSGMKPQVRVFSKRGKLMDQFLAYDAEFFGGVDVAATAGKIVTGAGAGGGPQVRVFTKHGKELAQFFAYDSDFKGGVRVSADANKIITVPNSNGGVDIRFFNMTGYYRKSETAFEDWWTGGFDVTTQAGTTYIASGPTGRRASLRLVD